MEPALLNGIVFAIGLATGYVVGFFFGRKRYVRHNRRTLTAAKFLQLVVVLAGVIVYIVNNIADIFVQGYDVSPLLQIVNGAIIGAAMNVNVLDAIRSFFQGQATPRRNAKRRK